MASCYGGDADAVNTGTLHVASNCPYLPIVQQVIIEGQAVSVELNCFQNEDEYNQGYTLMNDVIVEGKTWPYLDPYEDIKNYKAYFHSHASFAVRFCDPISHGTDILGCFYIKPNFPGRCSHICNGGFISNPKYRGLGVGTIMGEAFKVLAKDLGYRGSLFNLVFANNISSVKLWRKLGFTELAVIPGAAVLEGCDGFVDAIQMYYDFTKGDATGSSGNSSDITQEHNEPTAKTEAV